jgi:hypothetical protein
VLLAAQETARILLIPAIPAVLAVCILDSFKLNGMRRRIATRPE